MTDLELISAARDATKNSYAPYSGFHVGAALLCDSGEVFKGCNVENSSYGASVCAERMAIFSSVVKGNKDFLKIAIVGENENEYCPPCGICRQVMAEFCDENFEVILYNGNNVKKYKLAELLPDAFGL